MDDLIAIVRTYIEDEVSPYTVSDAIITRWLNTDRKYIHELAIYPEDYGYDNVSSVYPIGYMYISGLVLTDGDGNTISSSDYTVDVFNGLVTFDDDSTIPDSIYATFNYHDFFNAVSELWKYRAALARFSGRAKLGDEDIPMDAYNREYCIQKYWDFKQSKNITMER
jgi:hypothetical protein